MSLTGRFLIDRLKRVVSPYVRLPVPPYGQPNYWESSYQSLGPGDINEWGRVSLKNGLQKYRYRPVRLPSEFRIALGSSTAPLPSSKLDADRKESEDQYITTSFGETIKVYPEAPSDEPILIIGCGNSKLGEEMLEAKWRGPIIQVDISSRICDAMSIRCAPHLPNGNMQIVQDDATLLSAIADGKVNAMIDKGLVDALFCADEYSMIANCLKAAHRVLAPGGCFVIFSLSQPEFVLPRMLMRHGQQGVTVPWEKVEIRQLDTILLYRFTKKEEKALPRQIRNRRK
eukprot:scaffold244_cov172-Amphora_coffeaeformis.AAC.57